MNRDSGQRFISTAETAAALGVTKVTVLSYARRGLLAPQRRGRGWSFEQAAVAALRRRLVEESTSWVSLSDAAALTGLTEHRIKQGVATAQVRTRVAPRNHPTLERESLLRFAQQVAATPPAPRRLKPPRPPDSSGAWLNTDQAAALLGVSRQRVGQLAREERLPATRRGRFWWFRREHVERLLAARDFALQEPVPTSRM